LSDVHTVYGGLRNAVWEWLAVLHGARHCM